MLKLLFIAVGGGIGSLARFGTGALLARAIERSLFPWGTLAVNVVGCLLIGYLNGLFDHRLVREELRFLLVVGFLGGYATFSAFGWEVGSLLRHDQWLRAMAYLL